MKLERTIPNFDPKKVKVIEDFGGFKVVEDNFVYQNVLSDCFQTREEAETHAKKLKSNSDYNRTIGQ